ncbi:uncharacterized protein EHS24_006174 [Apiotrichum porosum]|uniref:Uncharacterized protein n=1 Tax=Apiotrichum porosum TaxID=105984 RepID=A0A427Y0U6_9TREE|nr:uncharacterized protein EHS24_006174 [Apiotrichum porosum]RSH84650.1 hypothetical protein EHS24_006174 [Apiotrichum porosum]
MSNNNTPVELAVWDSAYQSRIIQMLYFWLALPFCLPALRCGRGLLPLAPSFCVNPSLYGVLRVQDATLFINVVESVVATSGFSKPEALIIGPLSILWDIVVDTLDPMATTASGSQASMTPQDCQAIAHIKQSLNPGELPSAVALDTSAPNCAMRHIFAELRSLSV